MQAGSGGKGQKGGRKKGRKMVERGVGMYAVRREAGSRRKEVGRKAGRR